MEAQVTFYKGRLVVELLAKTSSDKVVTSLDTPGVIGQVIMDTKNNLGVSQEALDAMKKLRPGRDSLGDLDWFETDGNKSAFGWLGGPYGIFSLDSVVTSRQWKVGNCVIIPNNVPAGASDAIDNGL